VSFTDCLGPRLSKVGGPDIGVAHGQGRRSLWDRGTCPPNIYEGGAYMVMSSQYFRSDVVYDV